MARCDGLFVAALALLFSLAGCGPMRQPADPPPGAPSGAAVSAPAEIEADFAAEMAARFAPQPGSRVFRVRPAQSLVQIRVFREGSLARLGHNHLIAVRQLRGWWRQAADGTGTAQLWFDVDRLTVDEPVLRQAAGPGFGRQPDAAAVAATRANMLGDQVLAAETHPRVRIAASYRPSDLSAGLEIELRGVRREFRLPVELVADGPLRVVRGELPLRLSDFGLEPFSALGGALRVADQLQIGFRIEAEPVSD